VQCGTFRSLALSLQERWQRKFHSTKSRSYIMKCLLNGGVAWRHLWWVLKHTTLIPSQMSAAMLPTLNSPLLRQNEHLKEHRIWPPRKNIIITTSECITLQRSKIGCIHLHLVSHDWLWQMVTNDEKLYLLFRKYINAILVMRNIWRWSIQTNWWSSDICLSLFEGGDRLLVSKFQIRPCLVYSYHMTKRWQKVTRWWKIVM